MSARYVEIEYDEFVRETPNAVLLVIEGNEVWLPWSQIEDGQELEEDGGRLSVTRWICDQKDLAYGEL